MIEPRFLAVLHVIHSRLRDSGIDWAITGSLGMALQGVEVDVHDIDLQTDSSGAYGIERRFAECVIRPVAFSASKRIRSHLGAIQIDGVIVEIIGDLQKQLDSGLWEVPIRVLDHALWVDKDGMHLPVLRLEYEYQAYLQMGRVEKAELLRDWLQRTGRSTSTASPTPGSEGVS